MGINPGEASRLWLSGPVWIPRLSRVCTSSVFRHPFSRFPRPVSASVFHTHLINEVLWSHFKFKEYFLKQNPNQKWQPSQNLPQPRSSGSFPSKEVLRTL